MNIVLMFKILINVLNNIFSQRPCASEPNLTLVKSGFMTSRSKCIPPVSVPHFSCEKLRKAIPIIDGCYVG